MKTKTHVKINGKIESAFLHIGKRVRQGAAIKQMPAIDSSRLLWFGSASSRAMIPYFYVG